MNNCPHCGRELIPYVELLSLWQCPVNFEVYETSPKPSPKTEQTVLNQVNKELSLARFED